jgi:hypothetical protein
MGLLENRLSFYDLPFIVEVRINNYCEFSIEVQSLNLKMC